MPRKAFVTDLQEATSSSVLSNVHNIRAGEDDGTFTFTYKQVRAGSIAVTVHMHVSDVGDYPASHQYFIYTNSENVPPQVTDALSDGDAYTGLRVSQVISKIAKTLDMVTAGSRENPVFLDDDAMDIDSPPATESSDEEFEADDEGVESDDIFEDNEYAFQSVQRRMTGTSHSATRPHANDIQIQEHKNRIRSDLHTVKKAGFHVGHLGSILDGGPAYLVLAIRISKLGIAEDALQAWQLEAQSYVMLLIHYPHGYKNLEDLIAARGRSPDVRMRVGVCQKQKISISEAVEAFSRHDTKDRKKSEFRTDQADEKDNQTPNMNSSSPTTHFSPLFISGPLDELLNERLLALLVYRTDMALRWGGAEEYYNDHQGRNHSGKDDMDNKYWQEKESKIVSHLPSVVTADHLLDLPKKLSFPLLAMQYFLRHLVRCTEFCLVCHCRIGTDWEALMPYVCDKSLCLYQYMALGFGPRLEHAIMTQPHVVDLLVSFCYASVSAQVLKDFPIGMDLTVPHPALIPGLSTRTQNMPYGHRSNSGFAATAINSAEPSRTASCICKASFDPIREELLFAKGMVERPLRVGDWICLLAVGNDEEKQYRRVLETWYPIVRLGPAVFVKRVANPDFDAYTNQIGINVQRHGTPALSTAAVIATPTPAATPPPMPRTSTAIYMEVEFVKFDQHFDELSDPEKQSAIRMLLDTLPSVTEMRAHLQSMGEKHMSLQAWTERIIPAARGVLRWIVASNRSCILQIDSSDGRKSRSEERVSGMQSYMQFRFAQGAPDKEQRFLKAVHETTQRLSLKYPTLFAWHGSALMNWHGIIREGLHFKDKLHGRAFGDGVYFSNSYQVSQGYTGHHYHSPYPWPQSQLQITEAICLNEIVNARNEFVSHSPHLVVNQLDWIQTRYLFVKCNTTSLALETREDKPLVQFLEQDPTLLPTGPNKQPIMIPITAISKSRRPAVKGLKIGHNKSKSKSSMNVSEDTLVSDDTDIEDRKILEDETTLSETESDSEVITYNPQNRTSKSGKQKSLSSFVGNLLGKRTMEAPKTDFVPGTLDHSKLPLFAPPSYATALATKALQRELNATLKAQATHPAHELGWYLDGELVTNVYQWIVELHSFEAHLPLAQDMKTRGIKSIVLELRFGKGFPYSPPFVRVIRPRFLPFMFGGGGHVTAGGALCMELLTNSGWNPASSIEAVLLQVRLAISSTDPKPARLEHAKMNDYGVGEAVEAFKRACQAHGWQVPDDFSSIS